MLDIMFDFSYFFFVFVALFIFFPDIFKISFSFIFVVKEILTKGEISYIFKQDSTRGKQQKQQQATIDNTNWYK